MVYTQESGTMQEIQQKNAKDSVKIWHKGNPCPK